jgi:hypothetical protein
MLNFKSNFFIKTLKFLIFGIFAIAPIQYAQTLPFDKIGIKDRGASVKTNNFRSDNLLALFTPNNEKVIFKNEHNTFSLAENPFQIIIRTPDGKIIFNTSQSPLFKINSKWISISNILSTKNITEDSVNVELQLNNKNKAQLTIAKKTSSFYRIIISADVKNITAVKGINLLNSVEEIYGFGEMWNGSVAQRGKAFDLWDVSGTPDECAYMPYYVSTRNYAFWLEYGGLVHFDIGKSNCNELTWEFPGNKVVMNMYIGNSLADAVKGFVKATNTKPQNHRVERLNHGHGLCTTPINPVQFTFRG